MRIPNHLFFRKPSSFSDIAKKPFTESKIVKIKNEVQK